MQFDDLLSRCDDSDLQELLGQPALRLLRLLDESLTTPSRLRDLVVSMRTRQALLLSQDSRAVLVDLLRESEAALLAQTLGVSAAGDVYQGLKALKAASGTEREFLLCQFFGLYPPEHEPLIQEPSSEEIGAGYPLFAHQRRAARAVLKTLSAEPHRVLLHMPTGSGKTRTAMNVVSEHIRGREPTLGVWLAYSEELCDQAATEFSRAWSMLGDRPIPLLRFWGGHTLALDDLRDGMVVASVGKLYNAALKDISFIGKLGARSSLVVIDEAHQAIAPTYKLVLDALHHIGPSSVLLGLTATPGRTWSDISADEQLAEFFRRRKVSLEVPGYDNPVAYLESEGYLARTEFRPLMHTTGVKLSAADLRAIEQELDIPRSVLEQLADDEQRNLRIVVETERLAGAHARIVVFAASVRHSDLLALVLRARGHEADSVTGVTPTSDRQRVIERFREPNGGTRILCNYGVLTTGFDAPKTSAAVIARPTKSLVLYSQMVGRAIRGPRAGGNEKAEIVTVVDYNLPGFGAVADAFSNWEDVWTCPITT